MKQKKEHIDFGKWPTREEYDEMTELKRRVMGRLSWDDYEAIEKMGVDVECLKKTGKIRKIDKGK